MDNRQFEYGPWSRGVFTALIALIPLVGILSPGRLGYYVAFLIFLGFGLRFVLENFGIYQAWCLMTQKLFGKAEQRRLARRRHEIAIRQRDKLYRHSRSRNNDQRLPKNW